MKKLLTSDQQLIKEVEDVLVTKGIPFVTYEPKENHKIVAVLNKNGKHLYDAVEEAGKGKKYYLGVLRNHPEYCTPKDLIESLNSGVDF